MHQGSGNALVTIVGCRGEWDRQATVQTTAHPRVRKRAGRAAGDYVSGEGDVEEKEGARGLLSGEETGGWWVARRMVGEKAGGW
jgi:hypothetical protein